MDHSEELQEMILLLQDLGTVDLDTETNAIHLPLLTDEDCIHNLLMSRHQWSYQRLEVEKLLRESNIIEHYNKWNKKYDISKNPKGIGINRHTAMYATIIAKSSNPEPKPIK